MPQPITQLGEYTTITASAFIPIIDINEQIASKNKKMSVDELRKVYFKFNLTSSFTKHTPGMYYFGDNRDGALNLTGSISTIRTFVSRSFSSTLDGPPIIKNFSSIFISRSVVVCPTNRCRGMLIFVDGDATISGSISMTVRGAKFSGSDASFRVVNPPYLGDYWSTQLFPSASYLSRVFAVGAAGGPQDTAGVSGTLGRSGGGGGGSSRNAPAGATGGTGTSFSGGAGAGGSGWGSAVGFAGSPQGGAGGAGNGAPGGGGGAGNPGGAAAPGNGTAGENGTGGLLVLIVRGNLKIGPNGSIITNGGSGGAGSNTPGQGGGGGGGSGGGVLYVYYGGTLTNNGSVAASGGTGGVPGGGAGGAGTVVLSKLNTAFPVIN